MSASDHANDGAPTPPDPMTSMMGLAAMAHELFLTLKGQGFNDQQSLYLVGEVLTAGMRPHS